MSGQTFADKLNALVSLEVSRGTIHDPVAISDTIGQRHMDRCWRVDADALAPSPLPALQGGGVMASDYCFGLTATRHGMSGAQKGALRFFLEGGTGKLHHGLCVGGDTDGHHIARELGFWIIGHPPTNAALRADLQCDEMRPEKPYLTRNKNIVNETIALIAAPAEMEEQPRGGTWSTVRYARRQGKAVVLILPNGTINQTNRSARSGGGAGNRRGAWVKG